MFGLPTLEYYVVLFIVGAVIGSFLNVVIYRLPIILHRQWENDAHAMLDMPHPNNIKNAPKFNLLYPGSHCPSCKQKVPYWANIPILGYFMLLGRCHTCKQHISLCYPSIEFITALLFVYAGFINMYASPLTLLAYLVFICFILCMIVIDYTHLILPDILTLPFLWLGLLFNCWYNFAPDLNNAVMGAVLAYLMLWSVYQGFKLITKMDGMGFGDFKLFAALGAWFGYQAILPLILAASLMSIMYTGILAICGKYKRHQHIPFGPFLGIAGLMYLFISPQVDLAKLILGIQNF